MNKLNRAIAIFTVAGLLAVTGCGPGQDEVAEKPIPVTVEIVQSTDISSVTYANTRVEGLEEALIYAMTPGTVEEVLVTEGDSVHAGQQLIRMDTDQQLSAGTASAVAGISAADANADNLRSNYERMQVLYEAGGVSLQQLEAAGTALEGAQAQLNQAYAGYTQARSVRDNAWITAPFDGEVGRIWARPGNSSMNTPLLSISSNATIVARILLPEGDLLQVMAGLPAYVTVSALDHQSFPGVVTSAASSVDPISGLVPVEVTFLDPDPQLRPGMAGRVTVLLETIMETVAVEESVLRRTQQGFEVVVVEDGEVAIRQVTTGIYNDGMVQIVTGLQPGDSLVVTGHSMLHSGSMIEVVDR